MLPLTDLAQSIFIAGLGSCVGYLQALRLTRPIPVPTGRWRFVILAGSSVLAFAFDRALAAYLSYRYPLAPMARPFLLPFLFGVAFSLHISKRLIKAKGPSLG